MAKKTCFVIIGFGKKTSYASGKSRILDLDETYELLIKPVFEELDIDCYRAIDKNTTGSIDKLMLHEIKHADIAIADLSTLNANVMWELGVRHALKPQHTIMICEKEQMKSIPFDVHSFVIYEYAHSEEGIPYKEVNKFKETLKKTIQKILAQTSPVIDSPVFTFLDEISRNAITPKHEEQDGLSFASLMKKAEEAKDNADFIEAYTLYDEAERYATGSFLNSNLPFIISRKALCTYKSKLPTEEKALLKASEMLKPLNPEQTHDTEVLGLSGAINKRLYEISNKESLLDKSISYYEKGFLIKQDYYNGINAVFMLLQKATLEKRKGNDTEEIAIQANYLRNAVLKIVLALEADENFDSKQDAVWILYTAAEAYMYKGDFLKQQEYEEKAGKKANDFARNSYNQQKEKHLKIALL